MTRLCLSAMLLALVLVAPRPAVAEPPEADKDRYALTPVDGGVLRLDKQTGAVALCAKQADAWRCDDVEDKAKAAAEKLMKLERENQDLQGRIADLERKLEDPAKGAGEAGKNGDKGPPSGTMPVPSEEDVDKAIGYIERMVKKLRERIERLDKPTPDAKPDPGDGSGRL